ncbi:hypothetical protein NW766_009597 [Fusarium irregulare]|uniref:Uncharacterized protein n=1 Tax=Fusarium irregulare TaxID=2494466 RepID=A0A9W8PI35_9HYPO|nr:hypothetical protein NW766_009597 [Fusarium irregulare]
MPKLEPYQNLKELKFAKDDGTSDNDIKTPKKLSTTGSKWNRTHLFACHVTVIILGVPLLPAYSRVPINENHHDTAKLRSFIDGPAEPHNRLQHRWIRQLGDFSGE